MNAKDADPVSGIDTDALCAEHARIAKQRDAMPPEWKALQADYDRLGVHLAQIEQILAACGVQPERPAETPEPDQEVDQ